MGLCSCGFLILAGFEGVVSGDEALAGALADKATPEVRGVAVQSARVGNQAVKPGLASLSSAPFMQRNLHYGEYHTPSLENRQHLSFLNGSGYAFGNEALLARP